MVRLLALLCLMAAPASAQEMRLTIEPHPRAGEVVAGEMVPVTIRAVYDLKVANEKLEIAPSEAFDWLQIAPDDWHDERIGGLPRIVMERRLAIFPRRSGVQHFGPVRHHLTVIDPQSRRQEMTVTAQPVEIGVGAFPRERGWKLAAHDVTLTDELSTDAARLADGETVTRRVTLRAAGALPEMLPPRPIVSENWLITFAAPVERTLTLTAEGPVAEAVWTWQFRPETGEPGVLEGVEIPYFDTGTRQMAKVEIPPLPIAYASFAASRVDAGQFGPGARAAMAGAAAAGLAAGLAITLWFRAPVGLLAGLERIGRRWSPARRLRQGRAARQGDLIALRREAEAALGPATPAGATDAARADAARDALLAPLDQAIYARDGAAGFDPLRFLRQLRRYLSRHG